MYGVLFQEPQVNTEETRWELVIVYRELSNCILRTHSNRPRFVLLLLPLYRGWCYNIEMWSQCFCIHGGWDVLPLSTQSSLSRSGAVEETEKRAPRKRGSSQAGSRQTHGAAGRTDWSDTSWLHSFVVRQAWKKPQSYVQTVCAEGGTHEDLLTTVRSRWWEKNQELGVSGAQMLSGEQGQAFFFFW